MKTIVGALVMLLVLSLLTLGVSAQSGEPTLEQINEVARDLWCPLCNGVRLDVCELRACDQMRDTIKDKLMAGESKEEIIAYFVEKYGVVVLGEPPREGINWLPWLLPFAALLAGGAYVAYLGRRWTQRPRPQAVGPDRAPQTSPASPESDAYLKRVEEDLQRLD